MSIKYDLLAEQINALSVILDPYSTPDEQELQKLKGVKQLLEYIRDEDSSANLNAWQDESDDAVNEFVEPISDIEKFYTILANKEGFVSFNWHWSDVQDRAKENDIELTKVQSMDILMEAHRRHDAEVGISWDVLDVYIDMEIDNGEV